MAIIDQLIDKGIDIKDRRSGSIKTLCPQCSHSRKHSRDKCLSVNIDDGVWNCHNCGWNGSVKLEEETYEIPELNNTELQDDSLRYFKKRGINQGTIKRWAVTESEENGIRWINFNYFENEKLVNVKYRGKNKAFRLAKNAKLILYGIDLIKDQPECVITEGEFDALSFYEVGVLNVCSVPNGASKNSNLKYIDNCYKYFENKEKIIIATDNDEAGRSLKKELIRRIGADRCYEVDFEDCKDANDYLLKYGDAKLKEVVRNASPVPILGVSTVMDVENDLDDLYRSGYPKGATTKWWNFNNHLSFLGGQFTTITGIPGSGKSEWMDNLAIELNLKNQWKFGIFSPENSPIHYHVSKLCEKRAGKKMFADMSVDEYAQAKRYVYDNFYWINFNNEDLSISGILKKLEELIKRYGIRAGIIDPWNQLENKIPYGITETQFIGNALYEIMNFCLKHNFHLFLIAHPTKLRKNDDGEYSPPGLYDISGSAHFFNKTYNGLTVHRIMGTSTGNYLDDVKVFITKVRFKWCGKVGEVDFKLNGQTTRYEEV